MIPQEYISFGLAIFLGALIGTERQFAAGSAEKYFGGIRTFVFVAIAGALSAYIDDYHASGFFLLSFAGSSLLVMLSHLMTVFRGGDEGTTTEIVTPLVFGLGGMCWWQHYDLAITISIAILFFLSSKRLLHSLTSHLSYEDIRASVTLLVLTFIILPIVPNKGLGPFDALNPYRIWIFVILVSMLSFAAYIALRIFRETLGMIVTGLLGGIVSSTAATMTLSKRSTESPEHSELFAKGTMIASSIVPTRAIVLTLIAAPSLWKVAVQIAIPSLLIGAFVSYRIIRSKEHDSTTLSLTNPFRLKSALYFGLIFATATLLARVITEWLGNGAVLFVAGLSGSVSVDAAVLSLGDYTAAGLPPKYFGAGIAVAILSNCILKAGIARFFGTEKYWKTAIPIILAVGLSTLIPLIWL